MNKKRLIRLVENVSNPTVLGIDCSSATIGFGLIEISNPLRLVAYGHIKPLNAKNEEIIRLDNVFNEMRDLCDMLNPSFVSIEDIFLFMTGKSKARTITILTAFNRVASLALYQKIGNVNYYSVHQIRKIIKNAYNLKDVIEKEDIPSIINENLEKSFLGPINKKGNVAKEALDESDGIAAAWCFALLQLNPQLNKLLEVKTKKGKK